MQNMAGRRGLSFGRKDGLRKWPFQVKSNSTGKGQAVWNYSARGGRSQEPLAWLVVVGEGVEKSVRECWRSWLGCGGSEDQQRAGRPGGRRNETALAVEKSREADPRPEFAGEWLAACLEYLLPGRDGTWDTAVRHTELLLPALGIGSQAAGPESGGWERRLDLWAFSLQLTLRDTQCQWPLHHDEWFI